MNKERDYFFDNLKAVLIFLVVLGHFLLPIRGDNPLVVVKRLIYVFHREHPKVCVNLQTDVR